MSVMADIKFNCTNKAINDLLLTINLYDCEFGVVERKFEKTSWFGLSKTFEYRYEFYARNINRFYGGEIHDFQVLGYYTEKELLQILEFVSIFKSYALVFDFHKIQDYSIKESNSLLRRLGKTTEEVGEMAEAILCVEDPNNTSYKLLTTQDVKEECVDVILMVLSIFFDKKINGTLFELTNLLHKKCDKWYETSIMKTLGKK